MAPGAVLPAPVCPARGSRRPDGARPPDASSPTAPAVRDPPSLEASARARSRARPWPRLEELARAGKQALFLAFGCFPLMIIAGTLEMGVARAPQRFFGNEFKLAVAGVFALVFLTYSFLFGWERRTKPVEAPHAAA